MGFHASVSLPRPVRMWRAEVLCSPWPPDTASSTDQQAPKGEDMAHLKVILSGKGLSPSSLGCLGCSPMPSNTCVFLKIFRPYMQLVAILVA